MRRSFVLFFLATNAAQAIPPRCWQQAPDGTRIEVACTLPETWGGRIADRVGTLVSLGASAATYVALNPTAIGSLTAFAAGVGLSWRGVKKNIRAMQAEITRLNTTTEKGFKNATQQANSLETRVSQGFAKLGQQVTNLEGAVAQQNRVAGERHLKILDNFSELHTKVGGLQTLLTAQATQLEKLEGTVERTAQNYTEQLSAMEKRIIGEYRKTNKSPTKDVFKIGSANGGVLQRASLVRSSEGPANASAQAGGSSNT